jgi:hypothetical protein
VNSSRRGTFVLEILMAIAIVALALLPVINSMVEGYRQGSFTEDHLFAQACAQHILDAVLANRRALFRRGFPQDLPLPPLAGEPAAMGAWAARTRSDASWSHAAVDGSPDLRRITVIVRWRVHSVGAPVPDRQFVLTRLVARPDAGLCPTIPLEGAGEPVD